jgi:hypothetical protein
MTRTRAAAIKRICDDLGIPAGDAHTQDWEYELPEEFRSVAWMQRYIDAYREQRYGAPEKRVLMSLLLDCCNDAIAAGEDSAERLWDAMAPMLLADRDLHAGLIEHWSLPGEPLEDAFAITARVRDLMA